ncbi:glycosyltransferase [Nocardioides dubius]|uniref:Glycosyl transferase family 28 C-terminal domain-containing protein n=1 Tax=Nocardioides dubius TaxID=317019 RepID=A0ABN1TP60_9ACTN
MIGYYIHHQGRGHLHRATRLARELNGDVTGLSSLPRSDDWPGDWVQLPPDDLATAPVDPQARGALHWAPVGDLGNALRMQTISTWLTTHRPELMVSDVSAEVALLSRLHGVRVATVVLPGERGDPAHVLGRSVSDLLVAFWPSHASEMVSGLSAADAARLHRLGAVARCCPLGTDHPPEEGDGQARRVVVLGGAGGGGPTNAELALAQAATPDWEWRFLGGAGGPWVDDPHPFLRAADVVVTHAGEGALAEVAAARRPAVVLPQPRPHYEQFATARALAHGSWPAVVAGDAAAADWPSLLKRAAGLDGQRWSGWCDGLAPSRFARLVDEFLGDARRSA